MNDTERVLGKLEEFKDGTGRRLDRFESRFDKVEEKLDSLFKFRWQIIGGSTVISVLISVIGFFLNK